MDATEITLVTGQQHSVRGSLKEVESNILAASRGSIMQFAWLIESSSGQLIGINPASIVSLRGPSAPDLPPHQGA